MLRASVRRGKQHAIAHALQERVKELRCLYGIAQLVERCQGSVDQLMRGAVELLPPAWQYPEVACARVVFGGREYRSAGFERTVYRQAANISSGGKPAGVVEVCYVKKRPAWDEGPFLKEERALIDAVAEQLGRAASSMAADEALRSAHAQLQVERKALQETNAALRTVLARIEDEKSSIKQAIVANVDKILLPIIHAMAAELPADQKGYARLLRHNLEEIASPLVDKLSRTAMSLTPAEIRVCSMIKMGLSTKEIADFRRTAAGTISRQRENIRKKLGLAGRGVNLTTYLQTFSAGGVGQLQGKRI
jgi:DNA-binding NarL/FixJ family response regulator